MAKVLAISDMCTVGQCSLTAYVPVISAYGIECCPLATQLYSNHTAGFGSFECVSVLEFCKKAIESFKGKFTFDAILVGYLGGTEFIDLALSALPLLAPGGKLVVDPAMAEKGGLYPVLKSDYTVEISRLLKEADAILPNYYEAQILSGKSDANEAARELAKRYDCDVVVTGVPSDKPSYSDKYVGQIKSIASNAAGEVKEFAHGRVKKDYHGAGDVYAAAFVGEIVRGQNFFEATKAAQDFTFNAVLKTMLDEEHWYGLNFEQLLKTYKD